MLTVNTTLKEVINFQRDPPALKAGADAINPSMRHILEGSGHIIGLCEAYHFEPGSLGEQYLNKHGYVHGYYRGSRDYCNSSRDMATA
jgi:hypothetical protein